jgi:two-component system, cell cycle sensor histidine kinase and response regulator CckA
MSSKDRMIGTGTILLIEDDEALIDILSTMLSMLGYGVAKARTGGEAVAIGRRLGNEIDCAILDIELPDMAAIDVYQGLMEAHPELMVLVSTGSDPEGNARDIMAAGAQGFIQKPYTLEALSEKLKEVVG